MKRKPRWDGPFEVEIDRLDRGGVGVGTCDGQRIEIKAAAPGTRVLVTPMGKSKGAWQAKKLATIRPSPERATPACPVFGLCGGCALQELNADGQRAAKLAFALAEIGDTAAGATIHPMISGSPSYGYRNKVELAIGSRRYLSEAAHRAGEPIEGRFIGFHAPGRFDRVVDVEACALLDPRGQPALTVARDAILDDPRDPWDVREHVGFWRHVTVRVAHATGEVLIGLHTASDDDISAIAEAVAAAPGVVGVQQIVSAAASDTTFGAVARTWGRATIRERLGEVWFDLSLPSFFQTSTAGAARLYDAVGAALGVEAHGAARGSLVDLYSGIGSIGLYLHQRFDRIVGVEENPVAVADARVNALNNGIQAEFHAARVEAVLPNLATWLGERPHLVVDPPRAGLHPKVAAALAEAPIDVLAYVACNPASLGRDAAILAGGGFRMTDLWVVDLFPQTGHVEAVARFSR
jgi:23S rRNA (uracil1939-C5)-methyltransferase